MDSSAYVTIGAVSPWAVSMDKNAPAGYSYDICVVCDNTAVTSQKSAWKVTLDLNLCKIYPIDEDDVEYYFSFEEEFFIGESDILSWFESLDGEPTLPECTISITGLFSDEDCVTPYTNTDVTLSYDEASALEMTFLTVAPTNQTEVFICVENYVNQI